MTSKTSLSLVRDCICALEPGNPVPRVVTEGCPIHRPRVQQARAVEIPTPREATTPLSGDLQLILKHVKIGHHLYVELRNGSRFVGVVVDMSPNLIELDSGLLSMRDIVFVSNKTIPDIRAFT